MSVRALFSISALLLQLLLAATSAADEPPCRGICIFQLPCSEPISTLVNYVNDSRLQKDSQDKCMYEITKESSTDLEIKYTCKKSLQISTISFKFTPPAAPAFCKMGIVSRTTSQNAVTPNDYCLIYDLISGCGLTEAQGYKEIFNKKMCPIMESATCNTEE